MKLVFDIGGTSMRLARVDGAALRDVKKAATPPEGEHGFETLCELIERLAPDEGIEAIVGGLAGVLHEDGTLLGSPNLPGWSGFPLARRLQERFHIPVIIHNDSLLAALGEARYGAGRAHRVVAHLRIGTGVGGARIVQGKLEAHAKGFEPGHQVIDLSRGATLESLVGGASLARKYGASPSTLTREAYREATRALSIGVWNLIVHWSPDVVVLGGSLMNEETAYRLADVRIETEKLRTVLAQLPEIRVGTLGDDAGLYGAVALLAENV